MMVPQRVVERIRARIVVQDDGCWHWQGARTNGYGVIGWHESGKPLRALTHRAMYEAVVGQIPEGLQIDHMCHDPAECHLEESSECPHRRCCNPEHLKPSTLKENVLRGGGFAAENFVKARCPIGHPYDEANTYFAPNGWRQCKTCRREYQRMLRARRAAQLEASK